MQTLWIDQRNTLLIEAVGYFVRSEISAGFWRKYRSLVGGDEEKAVQAEEITLLEADESKVCLMTVNAQTSGSI